MFFKDLKMRLIFAKNNTIKVNIYYLMVCLYCSALAKSTIKALKRTINTVDSQFMQLFNLEIEVHTIK